MTLKDNDAGGADDQVKQIVQQTGYAKFKNGSRVVSLKTGSAYTLENVHPTRFGIPQATVRRTFPKVKGKAARKAEKKARRRRGPELL
jgi:hypothetical protein